MNSENRMSASQPEDILARHTPEVRTLVERLRKIVRDTIPDAVEAAYPGWHTIGYRHPESGYFCGIFPQNEGVNLGFEFGVLLPDPDELLQGTGKQVRYARVRDRRDIQVRAIKKLLVAAISLPDSGETKRGLVRSGAKPVQRRAK